MIYDKTLISVGILAYNEEKNIERTLRSLAGQIEYFDPSVLINVHVVINGTTDNTPHIASHFFKSQPMKRYNWMIHEIDQPGKANAWNQFIHEFSSNDTDFFMLMDSDIQFIRPGVVSQMLKSLQNTNKVVNVGYPLKSIFLKPRKSLIEKFSCAMSSKSNDGPPALCGQLYMAKAATLRKIMLPLGMLGDDGFIAEMISTNFMTEPYDSNKWMIAMQSPSHIFEAYTSFKSWFMHEKEQIKTIYCQKILYFEWFMWYDNEPIYNLISNNNQIDPNWLLSILKQYYGNRSSIFSMKELFFRRFKPFKLTRLPLALAATLADWIVLFMAHLDAKKGDFGKYWR